jgi:hypothetical protein
MLDLIHAFLVDLAQMSLGLAITFSHTKGGCKNHDFVLLLNDLKHREISNSRTELIEPIGEIINIPVSSYRSR